MGSSKGAAAAVREPVKSTTRTRPVALFLPSLVGGGAERVFLDIASGLAGRGLPVEINVHLELGRSALARRTPPGLAWTLPAYDRYAAEVQPVTWADVVVRVDDPRHPALVER